MLTHLRTLSPAATRVALTGVLVLSALTIPAAAPAHAAVAQVRSPVLPGTVLVPVPPRFELPVRAYRLTGRFGETSSLWHTVHTGLDFAAPTGTPIRSVADGVVLSTGYDGRYGNKTVIRLADGTQLWFCHQDSVLVHVGQRVTAGERIGFVGSTGNVTGPHLHLEVRPDPVRPVDPEPWLRAHALRP